MVADEEQWMAAAIEAARRCPPGVPRVGAVIVRDGVLLAEGHRDSLHAEHAALSSAAAAGADVRNASVFTTLEPCSKLGGGRIPCAQRLVDARVAEVFIGGYDRNPAIYRLGWKTLIDAGIRLRDFSPSARAVVAELNSVFDGYFTEGEGRSGGAKFDYSQNGGKFVIFADDTREDLVSTGWSQRGATSIYANAGVPGIVALARYATNLEQIDEPDALDYESHAVPVSVGEIVVFRSATLHALIKVKAIEPGPERGSVNTSVTVSWELRERHQ